MDSVPDRFSEAMHTAAEHFQRKEIDKRLGSGSSELADESLLQDGGSSCTEPRDDFFGANQRTGDLARRILNAACKFSPTFVVLGADCADIALAMSSAHEKPLSATFPCEDSTKFSVSAVASRSTGSGNPMETDTLNDYKWLNEMESVADVRGSAVVLSPPAEQLGNGGLDAGPSVYGAYELDNSDPLLLAGAAASFAVQKGLGAGETGEEDCGGYDDDSFIKADDTAASSFAGGEEEEEEEANGYGQEEFDHTSQTDSIGGGEMRAVNTTQMQSQQQQRESEGCALDVLGQPYSPLPRPQAAHSSRGVRSCEPDSPSNLSYSASVLPDFSSPLRFELLVSPRSNGVDRAVATTAIQAASDEELRHHYVSFRTHRARLVETVLHLAAQPRTSLGCSFILANQPK